MVPVIMVVLHIRFCVGDLLVLIHCTHAKNPFIEGVKSLEKLRHSELTVMVLASQRERIFEGSTIFAAARTRSRPSLVAFIELSLI